MRTLVLALLAAAPALASDLVGAESCRACHQEAYRIWKAGPHARAAQVVAADPKKPGLCLQCHSRDEAKGGAGVAGVSCETCHGGGRFYQPAVVMKDKELSRQFGLQETGEQSCLVCHGGSTTAVGPFDAKEAMKRIDHWTADREARKRQEPPHAAAHPRTRLGAWLAQKEQEKR